MFNNFLASLRPAPTTEAPETQRRFPRRVADRCVAVVHGQDLPGPELELRRSPPRGG